MTPEEWESYKNAPFLKKEMENYQKIVNAMQLLGDGKRQMSILPVALLLMRCYGIMDESLYTLLPEVLLQAVALLAEHGKEMVHIACRLDMLGQTDERIYYSLIIEFGNSRTTTIVLVKMCQLHRKHSCLQLIEAAVHPFV